jgi:hypothetical protein
MKKSRIRHKEYIDSEGVMKQLSLSSCFATDERPKFKNHIVLI